jgi:serine/threonine protein kinase
LSFFALPEVRLARQISHPNVCRVYDIGEATGELYLSMEYVDGEDLAGLLKRIAACRRTKASTSRGSSVRDWPPRTPGVFSTGTSSRATS